MGEIFSNYTFITVFTGSILLSIAASVVGSITVLRSQSLIGDSIGHSSFPGIVLFFMLFMTRNPLVLTLGAVFAGAIAYFLIRGLEKNSNTQTDTILAIVLSSFFGLGMVLKSFVQGNPKFSGVSYAGLQNYIFGQAAYMNAQDKRLIFAVSLAVLLLFFLFYKEIKLYIFDEKYGETQGFSSKKISWIVIVMTISIISVGLKIVGAILISAMLITPTVAALKLSKSYKNVLLLSALIGAVSAAVGTYISASIGGMSTGPSIVMVLSAIAIISIVFSALKSWFIRRAGRSDIKSSNKDDKSVIHSNAGRADIQHTGVGRANTGRANARRAK